MPCGSLPLTSLLVLITGGGSGINLSFAKQAVQRHDARGIIIADLRLTPEAQEFVNANSDKVVFKETDVTKRKDLEALVRVSKDCFGDVPDVWVAGAGVFEPAWSNWWDDTEEDRYAEIDINVNHALKLSRIAMRALLGKGKKGVILITSSGAGFQGTFGAPLYCASKHAVIGFVRSMAQLDQLEGIKVVAVAPGLVQTPLWTDRPATMAQFGYKEEYAVTPEFVAETMIELVVNGKYEGGTCLEATKEPVRALGTWNISPPGYATRPVPQETIDAALAPLKAVIEKEKQQRA